MLSKRPQAPNSKLWQCRLLRGSPAMASESDTESLRREDLNAARWSLADVDVNAVEPKLLHSAASAAAQISALASAALVPRAACLVLWDFLLSDERKSLVACCRESDSWCLRNAQDRRLEPKRRRELAGEPEPLPAPATPDPIPALLQLIERKVDRLANDLQRTTTFFANRQSLLDSRLSQLCLQLDAIREQVFVRQTAVSLQPDLRDVFDLNCPPHVAEQALQNSSVLIGAVRYHESRLDSVVNILDEVQAALSRR